jgi:hypothetical protein
VSFKKNSLRKDKSLNSVSPKKEVQDSNRIGLLPLSMNAMVLETPGKPLVSKKVPLPVPAAKQVLVKIIACGVCTELVPFD